MRRFLGSRPVILAFVLAGCVEQASPPGVLAEHQSGVINGELQPDLSFRVDGPGLAAKIVLGNGPSCSAVPFANQWLLTAAHCLLTKDRTLKAAGPPEININGLGAPAGIWVWDGTDNAPAKTNWVVAAHPSRDLALVHRWPIKDVTDPLKAAPTREPRLPVLSDDPATSSKPLVTGDILRDILGFGCTNLPTPNAGNSLRLFKGQMQVQAASTQVAAVDKVTLASWAANLLPLPDSPPDTGNNLAVGDSGGPARLKRNLGFKIQGAEASQLQLVGINYSVTGPKTGPITAC